MVAHLGIAGGCLCKVRFCCEGVPPLAGGVASHQLLIQGISNQFRSGSHSELDQEPRTIGAHSFNAQVQVFGDFSQAPALCNPLEDLDLPIRQDGREGVGAQGIPVL